MKSTNNMISATSIRWIKSKTDDYNLTTHHGVIWAWRPVVIVEAAPQVPGQLLRQGFPLFPGFPLFSHLPLFPLFPAIPSFLCLSSLLPAAPPDHLL